jgi:hypothetical protein
MSTLHCEIEEARILMALHLLERHSTEGATPLLQEVR